jgi:predicted transcriptional regulator
LYEDIRIKIFMAEVKVTESELEILQVLWDKGPSTVRDVHEELLKNKDAGYTTTLKLMQIMLEKDLVSRNTSSKTHVYTATVTKKETQKSALNKIIDTVFTGSTADLVIQALGSHRASKDEIDAIKKFLDQFENPEK